MTRLIIRTFVAALLVTSHGFAQSYPQMVGQLGNPPTASYPRAINPVLNNSMSSMMGHQMMRPMMMQPTMMQPSMMRPMMGQQQAPQPFAASMRPMARTVGFPSYDSQQIQQPYIGSAEPMAGLNAPMVGSTIPSDPIYVDPIQTAPIYSDPIYSGEMSGDFVGSDCASIMMEPGCGMTPSCGLESDGCKSTGLLGFCARNGLAMGSMLMSRFSTSCFYFGVDYGFANADSDVSHIGTTANTFGGTPTYGLDSGAVARYALGWDLHGLRFETEIGFQRSSLDASASGTGVRANDVLGVSGYSSSTTVMANLFYDFRNATYFTPYLRGGIGLSRIRTISDFTAAINSPALIAGLGLGGPTNFAGAFPKDESTEFAWNLGAGLAIDLTGAIKFDFEYQFLDVGSAATGFDANGDALSFGGGGMHEVTFGFRFYR